MLDERPFEQRLAIAASQAEQIRGVALIEGQSLKIVTNIGEASRYRVAAIERITPEVQVKNRFFVCPS